MKQTALAIALFVILPFSAAVEASDYDSGMSAYRAKNYAEALKWFQAGADKADAASRFRLGMLYARGLGTAKTPKKPCHCICKRQTRTILRPSTPSVAITCVVSRLNGISRKRTTI